MLELDNVPHILDPTYNRIFASMPWLETLVIHRRMISDAAFQALRKSSGLYPSLKRLDLSCCSNLTGATIVDVARSRLPGYVEGGDKMLPNLQVMVSKCSLVNEEDMLVLQGLTAPCGRRLEKHDGANCSRCYYFSLPLFQNSLLTVN